MADIPDTYPTMAGKQVVIFRLQLFKASEIFITTQVLALRQFSPIYLGRERFGLPPDCPNHALQDLTKSPRTTRILWNAVTRNPALFLKLIGKGRPALIHAHFGPDAVFALPLAQHLGIPLITTFHGFDVTVSTKELLKSRSPYLINYVLFRKQLARQGALFLCISDHIRERVLELGFPVQKTIRHYIGVDTASIHVAAPKPGNAKILHIARLVEKKGTEYLIRAFAEVNRKHPAARLTIIGEGILRGKLQALVESLDLVQKVIFLGAQPHHIVLEHLKESAFLVLPSVTAQSGDVEGLGIVLLEAAASGLPVIGTQHGGIPEVVHDGETGLLVPERDAAALAVAMDRLLGDESERLRMGIAARSFAETNFDIHSQTVLLENFYRQVLQ